MTRITRLGCTAITLMSLGCSESKASKGTADSNGADPVTTATTATSSAGGAAATSTDATATTSADATATTSGAGAAQSTGTGGDSSATTGSGSGGASSAGGATTANGGGEGGSGGGSSRPGCKRGIAANVAPGPMFFPAIAWWYNWAIQASGDDTGIEFVPMIWGAATAGDAIPGGSSYLLGFNEPNFFAQANLSAQQAAETWPDVETSADTEGVPIVSPAMNYCGPENMCHDTDPYQYLKEFFAACDGCQVDYVAVHWYNCDLPSLQDYLEPGGNLEGFEQFGLPIWLTEFSCDPNASVEDQEAYMREAIPYLESNPQVFRYSWFSAGPIPNAILINDDGSPTELGEIYIELEQEPCD